MKKIKIMLSAVALFALVGGALAFEAKKFGSTIYTGFSPNSCPIQTVNKTFTTVPNSGGKLWVTSNPAGINCTFSYTTDLQ